MKQRMLMYALAACLFFLKLPGLKAQNAPLMPRLDTLKISLADAEQRFVQQNLNLLAAHYNIDIAKAAIREARLWYNPSISYGQALYNPSTGKYFDNSARTGNFDVQFQQLISVSGRHRRLVELTKIDAQRAESAFYESLREFRFDLFTSINMLYAMQQKIKLYDKQIQNLDLLLRAAVQQQKLGVMAGNDIVRLRAEQQNVRNESLAIEGDLYDAQKKLKVLLHYPENVYIVAEREDKNVTLPNFQDALSQAEQNRPDLQLADRTVAYQGQNLRLQRSLGIPDMYLETDFSRAGSAWPNYYGIGVSTNLPVFNRNQAQISIAKSLIRQSELNDSLIHNSIRNEVQSSWLSLYRIQQQRLKIDPNYRNDLDLMETNAVSNYTKHYISLLEFLDQIRTYTDARLSLIEMNNDYFTSIDELNYTVGTNIVK